MNGMCGTISAATATTFIFIIILSFCLSFSLSLFFFFCSTPFEGKGLKRKNERKEKKSYANQIQFNTNVPQRRLTLRGRGYVYLVESFNHYGTVRPVCFSPATCSFQIVFISCSNIDSGNEEEFFAYPSICSRCSRTF